MDIKIIGGSLPNIPWEERPAGCTEPIWRFSQNPILGRHATLSVGRTFNSGCVPYKDGFAGVFRSDRKSGPPHIYFGRSTDGIKWEIEDQPIQWVDEAGAPFQPPYAYDPRLVQIEDTYYVVFCTDFGQGPTLGLGKTKDFKTFIRLENPFLVYNRNGILFPRKIGGYYQMMTRPSDASHTAFGDIYLSKSKDLEFWGRHRKLMTRGGGSWQSLKIGGGSVPIETDKGWLMFYHGVQQTCNGFVYSMGAALLDLERPDVVLRRSKEYLMAPEMDYETVGFVNNVCFPCASLVDAETGRIAIYYGAADTHIAIAFTTAQLVYDWLMREDNYVCCQGDNEEVR